MTKSTIIQETEDFFNAQNYAGAVSYIENHLSQTQSAEAYNQLGRAHFFQGQLDQAEAAFIKGIELNPEHQTLYGNIMNVMAAKGDFLKALEWGSLALRAYPDNADYLDTIRKILESLQPNFYNADIQRLLENCLANPEIDNTDLYGIWYSLLKLHPLFGPLLNAPLKSYKSFAKFMHKSPDTGHIALPYFTLGLSKLVVPDYDFELFITYLRRYLWENKHAYEKVFGATDITDLIIAVGVYAHQTEYVLYATPEEESQIDELGAYLEGADAPSLAEILLYGLYRPLSRLPDLNRFKPLLGEHERFASFLEVQITNFEAREAIKKDIKVLTPIDDAVSQGVQEQYEEFPYPRWHKLDKNADKSGHVNFLGEEKSTALCAKGAKILVAGGGTGKAALEYAYAFPDAQVTVVDLSQTSLSYSILKKQSENIKNIDFYQGDILHLSEALKPEYDLIVSIGVLHHMAEPEKGWAVLEKLLKPSGIMRIALYSALARGFVVRGHEIIRKKGYSDDDAGIRSFRHDAPKLFKKADYQTLLGTSDYYKLSECRDLLFHVHEQRFDIPRLKRALDLMGLTFYRFINLGDQTKALYQKTFPDDHEMNDLENWDRFEKKHPQTFLEMYQFFCFKS